MSDVMTRQERGEGDLTAAALRRLLDGVPDSAVVTIDQADPDDYRNQGRASWAFRAKWSV